MIGQRLVQVILTASEVTRLATRLDTLQLLRSAELSVVLLPGGLFLPIPRAGNFGRETFEMFCDKLQALIAEVKKARLPRS